MQTPSPQEAVHDSDGSDTDEEKYADQADMTGTKFDPKTRTTVRNLRIREDTAKYLYNLDQNSAFYDPKTRSMRENPFKNTKDPTQYVLGWGELLLCAYLWCTSMNFHFSCHAELNMLVTTS